MYDAESRWSITPKDQQSEGNFTRKHKIEAHKDYITTVYFTFNLGSNATHNKIIHVCGRWKIRNRKEIGFSYCSCEYDN